MLFTTSDLVSASATGDVLPHGALGLLGALPAAILLGALAAAIVPRSRLHWSWAPLAACLALGLVPLLGGGARFAALAAAWAGFGARRRHRADLDAGGDLARNARSRLTPVAAARRLGTGLASDPAL